MISLLAQTDPTHSTSWIAILALGIVINLAIGLGTLAKMLSGKSSERQIEPTQIAAITAELKGQTQTLNKLDREMGSLSSIVDAVDAKIDAQAAQVDNAFKRINAISMESAALKARVDGLEKREGRNNA